MKTKSRGVPASVCHTSGLVSDPQSFPSLLSRPRSGLKLLDGAQHTSVVLGSVFVLFTTVKVLFLCFKKKKKK